MVGRHEGLKGQGFGHRLSPLGMKLEDQILCYSITRFTTWSNNWNKNRIHFWTFSYFLCADANSGQKVTGFRWPLVPECPLKHY